MERLRAVISRPEVRLVTLTGPGGVGKTRLSLAAAAALEHAFPHGVFFPALAAVRDADVMWKTLAGDLDVDGDGPAAVLEHLRSRRMLLVLDNLSSSTGQRDRRRAARGRPGLVMLATSRGPLHVPNEHEFPVPTLDVARGADVKAVTECAAVRLFAQQAVMVRPGFAITADNAADVAAVSAAWTGCRPSNWPRPGSGCWRRRRCSPASAAPRPGHRRGRTAPASADPAEHRGLEL